MMDEEGKAREDHHHCISSTRSLPALQHCVVESMQQRRTDKTFDDEGEESSGL